MNALTVLVNIKPGGLEPLRARLAEIQAAPLTNPLMRIGDDDKTHSARWAIVGDADERPRLLLACEFDGDLTDYIHHLMAISPGLDAIWRHCDGYAGRDRFAEFIRRHAYPTHAFYIAFMDETVVGIRRKIAARRKLEEWLDGAGPAAAAMLGALSWLPSKAGPWRRFIDWINANRKAFHRAWLGVLLAIIEPITQFGQTRNFPRVTSYAKNPLTPRAQALKNIDGQMITITTLKPWRYWLVRVTFAINEFIGKYGWPPGEFADVGTLHSFRWVLIDDEKRLIFLSVFDGSWENYMGDFIDKIIWALDGVYKNTVGYPKGGMRDVATFQRWILNHQYEPQLMYGGYPGETVLNLIRDRSITHTLAKTLHSGRVDSQDVRTMLETL